MKLTRRRVIYVVLASFLIFIIGGGLDFTYGLLNLNANMAHPALSAFSPVAIMFYALGFVGIMLLYHGAVIVNKNEKLGKKQVEAGFVIIYFVLILLEILYRVTLNL